MTHSQSELGREGERERDEGKLTNSIEAHQLLFDNTFNDEQG